MTTHLLMTTSRKTHRRLLLLLFTSLAFVCSANAGETSQAEKKTEDKKDKEVTTIETHGKAVKSVDVQINFEEKQPPSPWSIGIALGAERYRTDLIEDASIDPERVLTVTNSTAWHNNLWTVGSRKFKEACNFGIFAAVKVVNEDGKAGFKDAAFGVSYTFVGDVPFSVGVGAVNHRTRTFGAGLEAGDTLPAEYGDEIPFHDRSEWGFLVLVSFDALPSLLSKGK